MLDVIIAGGSGYSGGELLRLLLDHPQVRVKAITSERLAGKPVTRAHPNLRGRTDLRFISTQDLPRADLLFLALPHGEGMRQWEFFSSLAPRIVDLSADYRLSNPNHYARYYGSPHPRPELLERFAYGIPELNREAISESQWVACAGCNATVTLLSLYPLYRSDWFHTERTVAEVKAGSSESGHRAGPASHHPERSGCLRSFAPTGHRHAAEIAQALNCPDDAPFHLSLTAVELVRGALVTAHLFPNRDLSERDIWRCYREAFQDEPFMRIVKERDGLYRYPEPKLLAGTNFCDVGFSLDPEGQRLVVIGAIDNLVKGAAGQAVQCMNLMHGFPEQTALGFPGLHPV